MAADERSDLETDDQPSQAPRRRAWWPGAALFERWRNRLPPRFDPQRSRVIFQPINRLIRWDGYAKDHQTEACAFPRCRADSEGYGRHDEVRPEGFIWEDVYFHSLEDALGNQAFREWYENGGQEIVERRDIVMRPAQYQPHEAPPLPRYNFLIHEHLGEMTPEEIHAYYARGEIPVRLRRRGRSKAKPSTLSISDEES